MLNRGGSSVDWSMVNDNGTFRLSTYTDGSGSGTNVLAGLGSNIGIGTITPGALLHANTTSTTGNTAIEALRLSHEDSNSAGANNIGTYISMTAESNSNGVFPEIGRVEAVMDDAANASKDSSLRFYTLGPDAGAGSNTATQKMVLDSYGNLGLGIDPPNASPTNYKLLHIYNPSSTAGHITGLVVSSADTGTTISDGMIIGYENAGVASIWLNENVPMTFGTNGTEQLRIAANGNLGVLNNNPDVALDVTGDIEYTGTIADVSDRRLKKDIQDLMTGQLDKVLKLQGVSFKMIEDAAGRTELGLIAQDVQEVFPELVQESSGGTLSLNYTGLIAPMIEAMKEQQTQIDELKAMNATLVSRIEKLEAQQ